MTILNELRSGPLWVRMKLEGICLERFNLFRTAELWDGALGSRYPPSGVKMATLNVEELGTVLLYPFLSVVIFEAS